MAFRAPLVLTKIKEAGIRLEAAKEDGGCSIKGIDQSIDGFENAVLSCQSSLLTSSIVPVGLLDMYISSYRLMGGSRSAPSAYFLYLS